ncbi:hypothetical protein [Planococcus sp. YIM B11945]|uniref:hypothetical protein n=1 Tax=Planococcus sp. YIM B11945 TaxID=3435410 RepID=UPI003D7C6E57
MKTVAAWFCIVGGLLWGLKPLYDWLVLERTINRGYVASDMTDYIKFVFPLLCFGGLAVLYSLYKNTARKSVIILAAALLFNSLFHFFEIYSPGSGIPFGLLFMFSGTVFLLMGALVLVVELKRTKGVPRQLGRLAETLFAATLLFCIFPFVSGIFTDAAATPILVALMLAVGFIWSAIGFSLLKIVQKEAAEIPKIGKAFQK